MITQTIDLNMIPESAPVIVHVNQYDTGEGRLIVNLYDGEQSYTPASGATVKVQGTKPDKKGFSYDATISGSTVTVDIEEQMTCVAGRTRTNLIITEGERKTGTFVFWLEVQATGLADDVDISETVLPEYIDGAQRAAREATEAAATVGQARDEAVAARDAAVPAAQTATTKAAEASASASSASASATAAEASAQRVEGEALTAEAWAVGTHNGEQIPSTDPAYNNHARYWAGQAEQFAQGGLIYKGSIAFANIPTSGMKVGDMYNITDDFTTDSRFQEGTGKLVKAGTNIAYNSSGKWDAMVALGIDSVPTQNSTNLITSGGVWSAIDTAITQVLAASY